MGNQQLPTTTTLKIPPSVLSLGKKQPSTPSTPPTSITPPTPITPISVNPHPIKATFEHDRPQTPPLTPMPINNSINNTTKSGKHLQQLERTGSMPMTVNNINRSSTLVLPTKLHEQENNQFNKNTGSDTILIKPTTNQLPHTPQVQRSMSLGGMTRSLSASKTSSLERGKNVSYGFDRRHTLLLEVNGIEEDIWSKIYGMKGKLDARVLVEVEKSKKVEMPLEIKTGKPHVSHRPQVCFLYCFSSQFYL
jgi:DNA replication factor Dna2.